MLLQELDSVGLQVTQEMLDDWVVFAERVFGVTLDDEQKEILRKIQTSKKISVRSGTSRGKDFVAALAAMCFMYTSPVWDEKGHLLENTKVFMTAPTDRQVGDIMYPEISRLKLAADRRGFPLPGRLVGYGIRTHFEEWFLTGFKADDNNTVAWTGYHAAHIMFIVTEASGISQTIIDAIEGNLQGDSKFLLVFNDNTGTGYASDTQENPEWERFSLNSLNAINVVEKKQIIPGQVNYEWVVDRVKNWCKPIAEADKKIEENDFLFEGAWYRPNDLFRVKILGLSPKVSQGVLVPKEWIKLANQKWKEAQRDHITDAIGNQGSTAKVTMATRPLRLGVDVAGMGRDSSVFLFRYHNYVDHIYQIQSGGAANQMEVAGHVFNNMKLNYNSFTGMIPQSFIDSIGEGAGVYSRMIELSTEKKENEFLKNRVFSAKGSEGGVWNDQPLTDKTEQYHFLNMRAYLYWCVRDWLNPDHKTGAMLPEDPELLEELVKTEWKFRSDGKIQIEAKEDIRERIKRSPDKADALALTFYPVKDIDPHPAKKKNYAQYFQ